MPYYPINVGLISLVLSVTALGTAFSQDTSESRISTLPSQETQRAIEDLPATEKDWNSGKDIEIRHFKISPEEIPPLSREKVTLDNNGQANIPFTVPNTMILQFEPEASYEQIENFLKTRNLVVIKKFPRIGAIQIEADLTPYFQSNIGDNNANQSLLRGLTTAIEDFQKDPLIRSATPDLFLRDQVQQFVGDISITNLMVPSDIVVATGINSNENTDWGIADIEADQLWDMPGAADGVLFGVMDVGFAKHEDLTFIEFPSDIEPADHGNHVAAIGCGRHGNGRGIRGVLPNCFVRARSGDVFFTSAEGGQVLSFLVLFSQILATLERFVDTHDDVHTFNVSLGYNWRSNFGINPDLPESKDWRTLVESQGTILVSLLDLANKSGKVIFSAAGNDSSGLATPIDAKFASPFNWAAITARENGIAQNGIIVEAHGADGQRAPFSNKGGHISCPGVDVLSAVAFDPQRNVSRAAYGRMSGTSMASPYCAAAHQLFLLVRPGYSGIEAVSCLLNSSDKSSSGTPMLRLTQALSACPARN